MKRFCLFVLALVLGLAAAAGARTRIVLVADGPWDRNRPVLDTFKRELTDLLGAEFGVSFTDDDFRTGDWTLDGIRRELDSALADRSVDVVIGLGVLASGDLARRSSLPKPAIAPFVLDPAIQGIPLRNGRSGVRNLSYITAVDTFRRELETFLDLVEFRNLAFLATSSVVDAIPGLSERTRAIGAEFGVDVTVIPVARSAADALAALPEGTEAVYVAPLLRLPDSEFDALAAGLLERRLPSFSLLGRAEVERGLLAGLTPEEEFERIARRCALNVQRILLGEPAAEIPVHFSNAEKLSLNVATARAIGVRPSWAVLTAADQVARDRKIAREITLQGTVREAIDANLDLLAEEYGVAAGRAEVSSARAALFPQIDVSALGLLIDKDQAEASFGQAAERSLSGTASVTQILFSDDALAGVEATRRGQLSREQQRDQLRLDIAQSAATAYLNVLRALTGERIQRDELERTDANLDLARTRESIGSSGPGEVFRWEGELATQRINVIEANAQRNVAEINLNRILNRDGEEPFRAADTGLESPGIGVGDSRLRSFLGDPWSFRVLREVLADVAVERSPELRALDEQIAAQERILRNTGRTFFLPTVGLSGEYNRTFGRGGAGADPAPGFTQRDRDWNVGIRASLPLFSGGARVSDRRAARETRDLLRTQRLAVERRVEQRIRSALHLAGASFAGIQLSREAADAARRNYDLIADAYSQGAVSVIDLIDAQNAAFIAEQGAASAVYDFLIDYIEVERAAGFLSCTGEDHSVDEILARLNAARETEENR